MCVVTEASATATIARALQFMNVSNQHAVHPTHTQRPVSVMSQLKKENKTYITHHSLHSSPFEICVDPQSATLCSMNIFLLSHLWDYSQCSPLSGIPFFPLLVSGRPQLTCHLCERCLPCPLRSTFPFPARPFRLTCT